MVASRVFVTLGLVALLLAILFLLIYIYVTQARNVTLLLVVAACGGAGGCRRAQWVQMGAVGFGRVRRLCVRDVSECPVGCIVTV